MTGKKEFDTMKVSKRLHDTHKARSISAENLAGAAGISKQALLNYESAARNGDLLGKARSVNGMSAETLFNLAEELGVSTDYLLGRTPAPSPDSSIRAVQEVTGLSSESVNKLMFFNRENRANWVMNIINTIVESALFDKLVLELRRYALDDLTTPIDTALAANTPNWQGYPIKKADVLSLIIDKDIDAIKKLLLDTYKPKREQYFLDNFIYQHIYSAYHEKKISKKRFEELIDIVDKMDFDEKLREFKNPNKLHNMFEEE